MPWKKHDLFAHWSKHLSTIIRPISSLLGGIPEKRAVYLPLEGVMTVIAKRCPFHVFWETKIKIVAVSTYFRLHNDETERSRHRKKNHDALLTMGNEQTQLD